MALSGVSRGTSTSVLRSLSMTSAARSTSDRDAPILMADRVPMEHGQMTIPALRADPEAGAAPRSASSYTVTRRRHACTPTRVRRASTESMSSSVCRSRSPCDVTMSQTGRSAASNCSSNRTAYGAPDAPVIATTSGRSEVMLLHPPRAETTPHYAVKQNKEEERDADHPVHREKSRVEMAEIVRAHERVFVKQKRPRQGDADPVPASRRNHEPDGDERRDAHAMHQACDANGRLLAERRGNGLEALLPVERHVLQRVENVEAGDPGSDADRERDEHPPRSAPGADDSQVPANRCDGKRDSENHVRPAGEPLREAVEEHPHERDRRQQQAQRVESRRRKDEQGGREEHGHPCLGDAEHTARQFA